MGSATVLPEEPAPAPRESSCLSLLRLAASLQPYADYRIPILDLLAHTHPCNCVCSGGSGW
jgi:hypothetical protein